VSPFLFIPWFKAEPVYVPLPFHVDFLPNGLPIQPFGILVAIGVLLGIRLAEEFAKRNGISPFAAYDFAMYTIIVGFAGALVLNVVFYEPEIIVEMFHDPRSFRWTGLSSYGGFFGAAAGVFLWKRKYKVPVLAISDSAIFGLVFGWIFGRLGCFVVHDHPGRVTDFPLAVADYHAGPLPYMPRHDLGFYEVLWSVAVSGLFLYLWRKPKRPPGFYLTLTILLYAPFRFMLDFLRAESAEGGDVRFGGLTPGHYASLVFLGLGIFLARKVFLQPPQQIPPEIALETGTIGVPADMQTAPVPPAEKPAEPVKAKSGGKKR